MAVYDVDITGALGNAFVQNAGSLVGQRKRQAVDDLLSANISRRYAQLGPGCFNDVSDNRVLLSGSGLRVIAVVARA